MVQLAEEYLRSGEVSGFIRVFQEAAEFCQGCDEEGEVTMILEFALVLALSQGRHPSTVTQELQRIEQELAATWKKGDCSAWGAMLAPEWSVIDLTGAVITKAEALQMCKALRAPIETLKIEELSVRAFGDAAVVTGRTTATTGGAKSATLILRFTDVFIRRAGRWQVVASQATQLGS